ncbi:MAG: Fpg/Nei family DNA glycosylase [Chitinivibrionales bacterium]|nr:Fpg/Nei family DNA glycosylase [Chitinivibrionales bacterium]
MMPELPDVETFRRYARRRGLHKRIKDVEIVDERILDDIPPRTFQAKLRGRTLDSAVRHGKYLFLTAGDTPVLLMHFGMTGKLAYAKGEHEDEKYDKIRLRFEDEHALIYQCRRLLGKVGLVGAIDEAVEALELGPDALAVSAKAFKDLLSSSPGMVKSVLMDQKRIAGIGNIYSDEILFHAGLHPRKTCKELSDNEIGNLYRALNEVLKTAVDVKADPSSLPNDYLLTHRSKEGKCPRCGGSVRAITVGGRRAWYCPSRQS